jgi:hypothetical protein
MRALLEAEQSTPADTRYSARPLTPCGSISPVSSRRGEEALQGVVFGGAVGDAVLPAAPDDVEPGAGQDADGVGMVVAAVAGSLVEVGGPGVVVMTVAGEVDQGAAELFVHGPAEGDDFDLARLPGGRCCTGQADEWLRGWGSGRGRRRSRPGVGQRARCQIGAGR